MGFDLGVNTRLNPPKLLPGFCWSRFQVGAAQQGFSFKTVYYPMVGTWGLLAHWFLELRFALLSALSQQLCAVIIFFDRIEMHTWMQMEGCSGETGMDSILWSCARYWKNMSCDSSSSGESGRSHPLLAYPRGKDPSSWWWRDARLRSHGRHKQPNGKQRLGSRFRSHCLAET